MAENVPSAKRSSAQPSEGRPKYVPLRDNQYSALAAVARELQDARTRKLERITENTLIRVAIDVVLAHRELLVGDTEEELRANALAYWKRLQEQAGGDHDRRDD